MKVFRVIFRRDGHLAEGIYFGKNKKDMITNNFREDTELIQIKDVTNTFNVNISSVCEALEKDGFGTIERDLVKLALESLSNKYNFV